MALFLGCAANATVVEWVTAKLLERMHRRRWWDYSDKKFNIGGFICLQFSLAWGAASIFMIMVLHPPIARLVSAIPDTASVWPALFCW